MTDTASDHETEPSFEEALARLETLVGRLEDGSLGLEESLRQFETGMGLLRQCHTLLESAEQKIQLLTGLTRNGEERTRDYTDQPTQTNEASAGGELEETPANESTAPDPDDKTLF